MPVTRRQAQAVWLAVVATRADTVSELLAPTGHLRVGVYPGSPTSMVVDPASGQTHGLAHDLGGELAKRLKVPIPRRGGRRRGLETAVSR